jgi:hypothetical protein
MIATLVMTIGMQACAMDLIVISCWLRCYANANTLYHALPDDETSETITTTRNTTGVTQARFDSRNGVTAVPIATQV